MASQSMSRRRFLTAVSAAASAVLGGSLFAACGTATPTPAPAGKAPEKPAEKSAAQSQPTAAPKAEAQPKSAGAVEVEIWAHWDQGIQWLINAMQNYNFPKSNITVKKVVYPFDEVHNKMLAACNAGAGVPDIMRVEQGRFSAFLKGEMCFIDLKNRIGNKMNDLILGSAVDYWSWKGQIYGIGNELNVCSLTYRKSVLDEVGAKTPFESWDDIRKAGLELKAKKNMSIISWHDTHDGDFQILLFAAGGEMFDKDGEFGGASELGVDILAMMHEMIHKEKTAIAAPVTGDSTWAPPIYWEAFRKDQIASTIGAPWHNGNLGREDKIGPSQSGQWRLQGLPKGFGANKRTATHGGTSLSIPKGAKHPDEAWEIIEFTHLTNAVLQDFDERGVMVTYKPALTDPKVTKPWEYYGGQKIGELYGEIAQDMPRIYQSPWAPEIHKAFTDLVITPILRDPNAGKKEIQDAFTKLKSEIERIKKL